MLTIDNWRRLPSFWQERGKAGRPSKASILSCVMPLDFLCRSWACIVRCDSRIVPLSVEKTSARHLPYNRCVHMHYRGIDIKRSCHNRYISHTAFGRSIHQKEYQCQLIASWDWSAHSLVLTRLASFQLYWLIGPSFYEWLDLREFHHDHHLSSSL